LASLFGQLLNGYEVVITGVERIDSIRLSEVKSYNVIGDTYFIDFECLLSADFFTKPKFSEGRLHPYIFSKHLRVNFYSSIDLKKKSVRSLLLAKVEEL